MDSVAEVRDQYKDLTDQCEFLHAHIKAIMKLKGHTCNSLKELLEIPRNSEWIDIKRMVEVEDLEINAHAMHVEILKSTVEGDVLALHTSVVADLQEFQEETSEFCLKMEAIDRRRRCPVPDRALERLIQASCEDMQAQTFRQYMGRIEETIERHLRGICRRREEIHYIVKRFLNVSARQAYQVERAFSVDPMEDLSHSFSLCDKAEMRIIDIHRQLCCRYQARAFETLVETEGNEDAQILVHAVGVVGYRIKARRGLSSVWVDEMVLVGDGYVHVVETQKLPRMGLLSAAIEGGMTSFKNEDRVFLRMGECELEISEKKIGFIASILKYRMMRLRFVCREQREHFMLRMSGAETVIPVGDESVTSDNPWIT